MTAPPIATPAMAPVDRSGPGTGDGEDVGEEMAAPLVEGAAPVGPAVVVMVITDGVRDVIVNVDVTVIVVCALSTLNTAISRVPASMSKGLIPKPHHHLRV